MPDKYQNKYQIKSARLEGYDYSKSGLYFVTIKTKDRKHLFGEIENGIIQLSEIEKIAEKEWIKTIKIRPDMNLQFKRRAPIHS